MSNLLESYRSLRNAINTEANLNEKREKYEDIYKILHEYIETYRGTFLFDAENDYVDKGINRFKKNMLLAIIIFLLAFGLMDFIFLFFLHNSTIIPISIGVGLGSFIASIHNDVKEYLSLRHRNLTLKKIEDVIGEDVNLDKMTLKEILREVSRLCDKVNEEISDTRESIIEYERNLNDLNNELAEDILHDNGIEAEVTLKTDVKILAKTYHER